MGKRATVRRLFATVLFGVSLQAQTPREDWLHVGNSLLNLSLADLSTGPVSRVSYSADGGTLYATTASGRIFETKDFESWQASAAAPPNAATAAAGIRLPEPGAQVRGQYAFGNFVYRSFNLGASWDNLTAWRSRSIVGKPFDVAVSPRDQEEVTAATSAGVYRSLDGGKSWSGLNQGLPNFPGANARLRSLPSGVRGIQLQLEEGKVVEWQPGEKLAWSPSTNAEALDEIKLRQSLQSKWGVPVTALHQEGAMAYAGLSDGRILVSADGMNTWQQTSALEAGNGPVESFWVNANDTRMALAVLGAGRTDASSRGLAWHILRTLTAGNTWDDITSNLSGDLNNGAVHGVAAALGSSGAGGAMYVATDQGLFHTLNAPNAPSGIVFWTRVEGLPAAPVTDVRLDAAGNQLWASVEGFGVYMTAAPHIMNSPATGQSQADPQIVSAADLTIRSAAPGALMTVPGRRVISARAGDLAVAVLANSAAESQIQIPFGARGDKLSLSLDAATGSRTLDLPLESVAPAIFVGPDGAPVLFDADTGAMLNSANPARARTHIQIMAAGLGRVTPDWSAGVDAPAENPPAVMADVRAMLDGAPVAVTRAVLAHGYVGWYLVEVEIPKIVNSGPSELYLDVDGHTSNRVRVYIEP